MEENLKFAVFIDYDNIEIGVRTTLGRDLDIAIVLEGIKQRGEIVAKVAYGNWGHHLEATRAFSEFGVHMVQRDSTPRGDKNGADINLALDAFEMAVTRDHINAFAIISGDSDFMSLVNKLKQYNKRVYIVGGKQFTSKILQRNCHEFISYESLLDILPSRSRRGRGGRSQPQQPRADAQPVSQIMPLVDRALNALDVRGAQPQLGLIKSTMLQLDPAFSEKDYGVSSFSSLAEKLVEEGYIKVVTVDNHHVVERSSRKVENNDQESSSQTPTPEEDASTAGSAPSGRSSRSRGRGGRSRGGRGRSSGESRPAREDGAETRTEEAPRERRPDSRPQPSSDPRTRLQQLLSPHTELLEMGIPAREVQALIKTDDSRFTPQKLGFDDFTALLDFAEAEELLRSIPDERNLLRFKPGDALGQAVEVEDETVSTESEESDSDETPRSSTRRRRRRRNAARRPDDDGAESDEDAAEEPDDDDDDSPVKDEEPAAEPVRKKAAKRKTAKKAAKKKAAKKKVAKKAAAKDDEADEE